VPAVPPLVDVTSYGRSGFQRASDISEVRTGDAPEFEKFLEVLSGATLSPGDGIGIGDGTFGNFEIRVAVSVGGPGEIKPGRRIVVS
jgi:hypothetical protein